MRHYERLRGVALAGPLVALGIGFAGFALIAFATQSAALWFIGLPVFLAVTWASVFAKVEIAVDATEVRFRAPLYKRTVNRSEIADVIVASDDGMNEGNVSWFVTPQDGGSRTRLNVGGHASVTVTVPGERSVQIVVNDLDTANRIAAALSS